MPSTGECRRGQARGQVDLAISFEETNFSKRPAPLTEGSSGLIYRPDPAIRDYRSHDPGIAGS